MFGCLALAEPAGAGVVIVPFDRSTKFNRAARRGARTLRAASPLLATPVFPRTVSRRVSTRHARVRAPLLYSKSNRRQDLSGLKCVIWRAATAVVAPKSFP